MTNYTLAQLRDGTGFARNTVVTHLTDTERSSLAIYLRVAAECYDQDAQVCADAASFNTAQQFRNQAIEAREFAARIEDLDQD